MIYINLGFPKTSTTNLQRNFYPYLKGINYLGRIFSNKDKDIFYYINLFIENRKVFSDQEYSILISDFKKYYFEHKKILISYENWLIPYQYNNQTNKVEIVPQETKLINKYF